jgi:hypothetical protein
LLFRFAFALAGLDRATAPAYYTFPFRLPFGEVSK